MLACGALVVPLGCSLLSDFSGISDGAKDGGANGGGDGASFDPCAGALFCDTFDAESLLPKWTEAHTLGPDLRIDTGRSDAPSQPGVLFTSVRTGENDNAYLKKDLEIPTPSKDAELSFSVLPEAQGTSGDACIATLTIGSHKLRIYASRSGMLLEDGVGSAPAKFENLGRVLPAKWTRVAFRITNGNLEVDLDGSNVFKGVAPNTWAADTSLVAVVGVHFLLNSPSGQFTFRFDDVRFTSK